MCLGASTGSLYETGHNDQTVCVQRVWKHSCYHDGKLSQLPSDWGEILWVRLPASVRYPETILQCLFSETVDVRLPHHTDQDSRATASTSLLFPHVDEFGESEKCVCARMHACLCVCVRKGFLFTAMCTKQGELPLRLVGDQRKDEQNYNNMERLMSKLQIWQGYSCLVICLV